MSSLRLAALALLGSSVAVPHVARQSSLDDWLAAQEPIAHQGVLNNIGPDGSKVPGASEGIVVASPSKSDPDYFYTWTRDASLTIKALVERFLITNDAELETVIKSFVSSQATLQRVDNPSGNIATGGLGEPKFHVDLTAFTDNWGRPQRDGPALRATALIGYSEYLLSQGDTDTVANDIWPIITSDLQYVASTWNETGFDLWEEVQGTSYFTLAAQHRSLIEGLAIASELGVDCIDCEAQAPLIRCLMSQMWSSEGYMIADINNSHDRSGKGTNTVIASIHSFDPNADCDDATFQPCSPRALSNLKVVADSMRGWAINSGVAQSEAPALGRYVEDVYFDGNPWYLTTTAAAEQLYFAIATWERLGSLTVDDVSLGFFQDIYESATQGTYETGSAEYDGITGAVRALADGYMSVVQTYTPDSGAMAEQFSKTDGTPLSAADLTWSYAALLTSKSARDGHLPPSWGAGGASEAC